MSEALKLLRDLIALPSVNPGEGPLDETHGEQRVALYLRDWLQARGIDCVLEDVLPGRPNLIARLEGRGGPALIFEAHMDTVEAGQMEIAPFEPEEREGRIYGRGACDCKAALAAMCMALVQTAQAGPPPGDVTLVAACDEEFRYRGIKAFVESGGRGAGGVVGEPTGLRVVVAHKGALRGHIITRGRAAHSSQPEAGENAIMHMAHLLLALERYGQELSQRPPHPWVGRPTISVGLIAGGEAINVVPDRCQIAFDRRLLPGEAPEAVEAEMRAWLRKNVQVPWELYVTLADEGYEADLESPIVRRAAAAVEAVRGKSALAGVHYSTDASKLARTGTPCVVLGPGDIAQAHTSVEWVEGAEVEAATAIYGRLMQEGL